MDIIEEMEEMEEFRRALKNVLESIIDELSPQIETIIKLIDDNVEEIYD